MKKLSVLLAVVVGLWLSTSQVSAGGYANPFNAPKVQNPLQRLFKKQALPAFQAAPWYLYFPYNSHFQTPAPLFGPSGYDQNPYGGYGGGNPYFPNYQAPQRK